MMKVVEIFNSIEGEGKRVGAPTTFIRLYGCNLACKYCDSKYAWTGNEYTTMSIEEILEVVKKFGCPNVTITGGEPLIHEGIDNLINKLRTNLFHINIETNGTVIPKDYGSYVFYTVDFKTNASGMSDRMSKSVFRTLTPNDVVKCVVGSKDDMEQALNYLEDIRNPAIYISPVFGAIQPSEIVEFIKQHKLWHWNTQVQLHKIIWNPEERGV